MFLLGGTFLVVQWLKLHHSNAGGTGLIPSQGTKIPHATGPEKKKNVSLWCGVLCWATAIMAVMRLQGEK